MTKVASIALAIAAFAEVWLVDFEFVGRPGERPIVVCMVAREVRSGRNLCMWKDELEELPGAPYNTGPTSLVVGYYAVAALSCHLALGWDTPTNVLDLCVEFKNSVNGRITPCGTGLLGALAFYDLPAINTADKEEMRNLIIGGGPWSSEERDAILRYCSSDVDALEQLLPRMLPQIHLGRALLRGLYMGAVAQMEHRGIPIDVETLAQLRAHWEEIKTCLVDRIDADFGVFENATFKRDKFVSYLRRNNIPWPLLPSGQLALDDDTFREMSRSFPALAPLHEVRYTLAKLRLADLAVGKDGRNRSPFWAFGARTGRNTPSSSSFVFGPAVWVRSLIQPGPGMAVAYVDWSQQEFGIAAALSGDAAMINSYESSDPHIAFGKLAGLIPPDGTKTTHGAQRDLCKACILAVQYGMGPDALAGRIGQSPAHARELLNLHRLTYPTFWSWSDAAVDHATLAGFLYTTYGWQIVAGSEFNSRSLRNFPVQANGAEMMRLAACFATERGIKLCASIHDAFLIEAPAAEIDDSVVAMQQAMANASAAVLAGLQLRTDAKIVRNPDRYADPRGERMWSTATDVLAELDKANELRTCNTDGLAPHTRSFFYLSSREA